MQLRQRQPVTAIHIAPIMEYSLIYQAVYCVNTDNRHRAGSKRLLTFVRVISTSPRERLRSIVMSMSVCLSVREDISGTTRTNFTKVFVRVAYVRGSVILRHVDDRPHRLSAGRG